MEIPEKYREFFSLIPSGEKLEMQDSQTRILVRTEHDTYRIVVDKGVIQNTRQEIKKSDFAVLDEDTQHFVLFELKGKVIDAAIEQLDETIKHFTNDEELRLLLSQRKRMDACIVSPERQQIPKDISTRQKDLAKKLFSRSSEKPNDMLSLIHFIRVVPKQKEVKNNPISRQILCSNANPLKLMDLKR